ncbi:sulfate ABC transporter ATP-binding protein [Bacillus sp. NP157]|nr:sulfate ABC transporter ATP-binding protein [Bacillus sp. NP157]
MTLALHGLTRQFTDLAALDDVSLDIAPGEFLALVGPSGSGKTTLLRILAGLDYPDAGSVTRDGQDFLAASARERNVGLVFQHYALFRHLTVRENVAFGLRVRPRRTRPSREQIRARVDQLLKRVQLAELGDRYPSQLSGGQRQRVALARALAVEPDLLLLDEPFGALDAQVRTALRRWLRELHEELNLTTVFVTHDQEEALELADRLVVMNKGRIEQVGEPQAIYHDPATPFVCEFIGRTNRIPLQRRGGDWTAGAWSTAAHPGDGGADAAVGYVRPEHLSLAVPEGQPAWQARLRHIYLAGSLAHLDMHVADIDLALELDVASEDLGRLALAQGRDYRVAPMRMVAFPLDGGRDGQPVAAGRWVS